MVSLLAIRADISIHFAKLIPTQELLRFPAPVQIRLGCNCRQRLGLIGSAYSYAYRPTDPREGAPAGAVARATAAISCCARSFEGGRKYFGKAWLRTSEVINSELPPLLRKVRLLKSNAAPVLRSTSQYVYGYVASLRVSSLAVV